MSEPNAAAGSELDAEVIQKLIEAEVAPLKEKIAELERKIELEPLNNKIKELDKKMNETA
jgi:DNA-binding transcriptional MerR regulator